MGQFPTTKILSKVGEDPTTIVQFHPGQNPTQNYMRRIKIRTMDMLLESCIAGQNPKGQNATQQGSILSFV